MTGFTLKATYASLPSTTRGKSLVINGDPKGENFLYCNGSNVFIRNIKNPSVCEVYTDHAKETTVAKYSPSRFYMASGDVTGKVRVWDTVNAEHLLKIEHPALGGQVKDIDWTKDSSKLAIVGEGRQLFGRVLTFDTGNSVGEINGHSKSINSVAIRQLRPLRIVTGGEDQYSAFFEGPPFRFKCTKCDHSNFVNSVRYTPDGDKYATGGADGKLFVYDGTTSELIGEIIDPNLERPKAHRSGIYAISFNSDGSKLLSVSADKTSKIWNIATKSLETEFVMGKYVEDMQVGCLWQNDDLLTVSVSGYINYLDPSNPAQPIKIIKGHNKPLMALDISSDASRLYTASSDGRIVSWNAETSECEDFKGNGHTNQVTDMKLDGDYLVTIGMDDMVIFTPAAGLEYNGTSIKLDSQPKAVDSKNGVTVVACISHLILFKHPGRKVFSLATTFEPLSVSMEPNGTEVTVGTKTSLHVYSLDNDTLIETRMEKAQEVCAVQYSPDGAWLAVAYRNKVQLYDVHNGEEQIQSWGQQHTSKITSLAWSQDCKKFVTSSIDSYIILWELKNFKGSKPSIKAHPLSHVNKVVWLDNNTVVTAGQDSNIRLWNVIIG